MRVLLTNGFAASSVNFPHGGLWVFGSHGLKIFSADGSKLLRHSEPKDICPLNDNNEYNCRSFSDVISDESRYVWTAADNRGSARVEVFDLDNGNLVGSFPTCSGARGFQFLPKRREVWFRCTTPHAGDPDGESGYWDSFSTTSLGQHFPEVALRSDLPQFNDTSYGKPAFIEDAGIGFASDYRTNVIHKVDLNARKPLANITIPLASGGWDIVYSPLNEHLFMRTYVCCTCGGEDKDQKECQQYRGGVHADPVIVLTGPSANPSEEQIGACGRHCDNSAADTIGVAEVDTKTGAIIGYHKNSIGLGSSAVHLSPNAEYIVLMSTAGAPGNIRLIKPGVNGAMSVR